MGDDSPPQKTLQGPPVAPRQVFREADADGSGDMDREELRIALRGPAKRRPQKQHMEWVNVG